MIGKFLFAALFALAFTTPGVAVADCTAPAATAGNYKYLTADNKWKFCDGTTWKDFICATTGGSAFSLAHLSETLGPTPGTSLNAPADVFVSGNYAYVVNNVRDSLAIINISNPASPAFVGELQNSTQLNGAIGVYVSGSYAYVANMERDSLAVINVSNARHVARRGIFRLRSRQLRLCGQQQSRFSCRHQRVQSGQPGIRR
jgi:hypothetical protein